MLPYMLSVCRNVPIANEFAPNSRMKQEAQDNIPDTMKTSQPIKHICAQPIMKFYHLKVNQKQHN